MLLEDLLAYNNLSNEMVRGIDIGLFFSYWEIYLSFIGAGASCIFPLLGSKKNNWCFVATELDEISLNYAKENVERNHLGEKIALVKADSEHVFQV